MSEQPYQLTQLLSERGNTNDNSKFINLIAREVISLFEMCFEAYCIRQGKEEMYLRFCYDGDRIQGHDTPIDLDMQDGDVIDVFLQQTGG
ncbi:7650_t:CDS:2 [Entrophospora sp. SA101]|nr:7650_t:CDS:2 [Entrophospora sp. SA101]